MSEKPGSTTLQDTETKYSKIGKSEPGDAVGVIASQSVSQPMTQMALSSFHHAGISSKNVVEGIPRLEEIMNLTFKSKGAFCDVVLKGPICPADVVNIKFIDLVDYYFIEEELDSWWYGIAESSGFYSKPDKCKEVVVLRLVFDVVKMYQLKLSLKKLTSIIEKIIREERLKVIPSPEYIGILDIANSEGYTRKNIRLELFEVLKEIILPIHISSSNIKNITIEGSRAITVGSDLKTILGVDNVDSEKTTSNSSTDVCNNLGIEAARMSLVIELSKVFMGKVTFSNPHINLIADFMTSSGKLVPINSSGVSQQSSSCLTKASYERTVKELINSSSFGQVDILDRVSESIITGSRAKIGTGMMDLFF